MDREKREKIELLKSKITEVESEYNFYKAMQLALKLVINGSYGAFAHPKFVVSNKDIANAITAQGRDVILFMLNHIENYFYQQWHLDTKIHRLLEKIYLAEKEGKWYALNVDFQIIGKPFKTLNDLIHNWGMSRDKIKEISLPHEDYEIKYERFLGSFQEVRPLNGEITKSREKMPGFAEMSPEQAKMYDTHFHLEEICQYGDTDSTFSGTLIHTNNGTYTIEDLYNKNIKNGSAGDTLKGHESVNCEEKVLNWDKSLYFAPVKRIIRHKVTKDKWKLKSKSGKEIVVTNDHSLVVFRGGEKIEVKPRDILKTDKILTINFNIFEFQFEDIESCECIGQFEDEYVYDIEMEDETHTFIANDILVHNSLYLTFQPVIDSTSYQGDGLEFILTLDRIFLKEMFAKRLEEYAASYGVKNLHDFELETINKSALHLEKKMYINNVVYEDGAFYEDLEHFYPKGIDVVRSSTPAFVRGKKQKGGIWEFIRYLFANPDSLNIREVLKILKDLRSQFEAVNIEEISMTTTLSKYREKVVDDQSTMEVIKGAHFSVKAAALHNFLLNKHGQFKTKYDLLKGGRVKWYFCKHSLNERFAYARNFHPVEILEKERLQIDYDKQFELCVLAIANRFLEPIGLPEVNRRLSVLNSLFGNSTLEEKRQEYKEELEEDLSFDWDF